MFLKEGEKLSMWEILLLLIAFGAGWAVLLGATHLLIKLYSKAKGIDLFSDHEKVFDGSEIIIVLFVAWVLGRFFGYISILATPLVSAFIIILLFSAADKLDNK